MRKKILPIFLIFLCPVVVQCALIRLPFQELFPQKSEFDEELLKVLPELYSEMSQLEKIMNGFDELAGLEIEISKGVYAEGTLKKLEGVCELGIKRTNSLFVEDFTRFKQENNDLPPFTRVEKYLMGSMVEEKKRVPDSNQFLCDLQRFIEIDRFKKKLLEVLPPGSDLTEVDYQTYENMVFDVQKLELALGNWTKSLELMWKRDDQTKKIVEEHGKFWLKLIKSSEKEIEEVETMIMGVGWENPQKIFLTTRNSLIKNFFETKILLSSPNNTQI
jgi:hypothetical protein